jgi:hypothetical protein
LRFSSHRFVFTHRPHADFRPSTWHDPGIDDAPLNEVRDRRDDNRVGSGPREETRLRQLLGVEEQLQALVRSATEEAAQRVAAAMAAREAHMAAARREAERLDEQRVAADAATHAAALAAVARASAVAVAALRDVPAARVDALARWALQQAIADGEAP